MTEEKIIKKEQLFSAGLTCGDLVLTPKRLYFVYNAGFFKTKFKNLFDIPIENIINVEATKNHLTTEFILKIRFTDEEKEEIEVKCTKTGWNVWKGRAAFKIEANLLNDWVRTIEEIRASKYNKQNDFSGLDELEKLAGLKEKGIITDIEFKKKKKEILN